MRCQLQTLARIGRCSRRMSSGVMFQLKMNPLTGNSEWVVIEEEEDVDPISPKPMLATTSYLDMLNDTPRNRAYRKAIHTIVSKDSHVLDIGSGTGLLSMMAARAMELSKSKGTVTACESYLPMVKLMKKVLRANNMEANIIRVINKRSDELQVGLDIASRANVLVSEILDSQLLGEGLIPTLQHAYDNLLVQNYQTVPYKATTYGQLVESKYLWKMHDLYNNEANVADGIQLVPKGKESILRVKSQQFAMHCDALGEDVRLLSEPFKIFEFDFWKRPNSHGETQLHINAIEDGTVHAVISWWVLQLDEEGKIFYSTAPKWITDNGLQCNRDWCDHWKQCVWFSKGKGVAVQKDKDVCMDATHTDTSISYEFKSESDGSDVEIINLSPERIAIYGDTHWRQTIIKALKLALEKKDSPPLCVIADDSIFLTMAIACLSKKSQIISLFPGLGEKGFQYLESVADENGFSMDQIEVINMRKQQWNHQNKVDILIAEPFYFGAEGMLPWHNLQFWSKRTMLDSMLSEDVCIMPCKGILKACAMSLPDLWRSRCPLEKIEGFDHKMVNSTLGASSTESPCLPFFIWQCGETEKLSDAYTVMEFDLLKPLTSCHGKAQMKLRDAEGVCHGFALWIDWVMDSSGEIVMSTGPDERYWKQGVKLLAKPLVVGKNSIICMEACFDPSTGEVSVNSNQH